MPECKLWSMVEELKSSKYKWVELSHPVGPKTPHWGGFKPMTVLEKALDFHEDGFDVLSYGYYLVSQYGTHIDCPAHFVPDGRTLEKVPVQNLLFPLCVIDVSSKVNKNNDYALTVEDIRKYESEYGCLPDNAFVAMRSDWSIIHADDYENKDAEGNSHYPGWTLESLKFLVEERKIGAIGHEPTDTDSPALGLGWIGERYILQQDKFQIEVMSNLDKVPATGAILLCSWPSVVGGVGFPARCVAIFER